MNFRFNFEVCGSFLIVFIYSISVSILKILGSVFILISVMAKEKFHLDYVFGCREIM